jgi:DHA1 family bicyclomycin/chloramphenicol resistance-like MFS transporter
LVAAVVITGFVNAALLAYLSGATFVLKGIDCLSPQEHSLAFGVNALGYVVLRFTAGRLDERWTEKGTLAIGLMMCPLGAAGLCPRPNVTTGHCLAGESPIPYE